MPKGRRKTRGTRSTKDQVSPGGAGVMLDDDDVDSIDNCSIISNISEATNRSLDEGFSDQTDTDGVTDTGTVCVEDFYEKLKDCIDGLSEKSASGRTNCLKSIITALSKRFLYDFLVDRYITICDGIERCLKKGKSEEQINACRCANSLLIQLGPGAEGEELSSQLKPLFSTLLMDKSAASKTRAACAQSIGLFTLIACCDMEMVLSVMSQLESIFADSYRKLDGALPVVSPETSLLHCEALSSWCLLLSLVPSSSVVIITDSHLNRLPKLLESSDVDLRIVAGEAIAMLYEIARFDDQDFEGYGIDELCQTLKQLATDSNKYRAKKDRRQQRSSFRDILKTVENGEGSRMCVKFGREELCIDSWIRKRQYDSLCNVLGSGMNLHLQENELVRDIFELGSVLPSSGQPRPRASKHERHMYNTATFKARTQARAKVRDKRFVHVSSGY